MAIQLIRALGQLIRTLTQLVRTLGQLIRALGQLIRTLEQPIRTLARLKRPVGWADGEVIRAARAVGRVCWPITPAVRPFPECILMAERRFPRPDGDFSAYMIHYFQAVKTWWVGHGLDLGGLSALEAALNAWVAAYPAHTAAQAAAGSARERKDAARAELEQQARPITSFIQSFPATTDADRATIGITIRSAGAGGGGSPTSVPLVIVNAGERLTHGLRLSDESTPTRRARPRGVERAEVFVALTPSMQPAPASIESYRYLGSTSDGATVLSFTSDKGGMQAHYLARWVTRRGAPGPWSATASATIAA
ncbi:MAG: hypothetical protein IT438_01705 [Phycisphaerales bacterium]|nr:hypothetical protein [Phycisphaerales bacterium]